MKNRVTLRDIAEKSGVHFTTVGLALRNDSRVKKETSDKVWEAAKELGYTKDVVLSALSSYRRNSRRFSGVIAYLASSNEKEYVSHNIRGKQTIDAAREHAKELGFGLEMISVMETGLTGRRVSGILKSRGITGIIVPPVPTQSGPFMPLEWNQFAPVALNYSITSPSLHRVSYNHMHGMRMQLEELRKLGYNRIGIALTHDMNIRTGWHWLGAFLAEQKQLPAAYAVAPLLAEKITADRLCNWIEYEKPEVIVVMEKHKIDWIRKGGWKVPEDIGVSLFSVESEDDGVTGIHEQSDLLGVAAVDFVVSMIVSGEKGVPRFPRYSLIDARWVPGKTTLKIG